MKGGMSTFKRSQGGCKRHSVYCRGVTGKCVVTCFTLQVVLSKAELVATDTVYAINGEWLQKQCHGCHQTRGDLFSYRGLESQGVGLVYITPME